MTHRTFSSDSSLDSQEAALADGVEEITQRIALGEPPDVEELCARYPRVAEQIRQLIPVMTVVGNHAISGNATLSHYIDISPDGNWLASACGPRVMLQDLTSDAPPIELATYCQRARS
jgi:hypothetical protein